MALALLIAGIFAVLAGLLAILFGFTVREFSLGSTLIISGTIAVCSGMLLAGLYVVVTELKGIARRLAGAPSEVRVRPVLPGLAAPEAPRRRNLMFASTSRKERERAESKATDGAPPPHLESGEAADIPPASFDDAW